MQRARELRAQEIELAKVCQTLSLECPHEKLLQAVCMGVHPRLGQHCALGILPDDILQMIMEKVMDV
jgi:hypothetical protein